MITPESEPPPPDLRTDVDPRERAHRPVQDFSYTPYAVPSLSTVRRIGVMGDLHGDLEHAMQAVQTFADRGVTCVVQLGDWGVLWPGTNWRIALRKISRALARHQMAMLVIDGNHEYFPKLLEFPIAADGIRWIAANIGHLPRGYRTQIGARFTLAALGGANSIDRRFRQEGVSWWPEEQITAADLRQLGSDHADVLLGHEAPLMDERALEKSARDAGYSPADIAYAAGSRVMFRQAVLQTRPRLTLGGHYHRHYDQTLSLPGQTHPTRVVVLDMNGKHRVNLAILHTTTLDLELLYRNGAPAEPDTNAPERTDNDRPQC
jgi:hypothetical protein